MVSVKAEVSSVFVWEKWIRIWAEKSFWAEQRKQRSKTMKVWNYMVYLENYKELSAPQVASGIKEGDFSVVFNLSCTCAWSGERRGVRCQCSGRLTSYMGTPGGGPRAVILFFFSNAMWPQCAGRGKNLHFGKETAAQWSYRPLGHYRSWWRSDEWRSFKF